ncbi:MAG: hypothetical protein ACREMW_02915 [Gemmatimonadales bacterium]
MDTRRQVVLLAIALFAGALGPATVQAQVDQSALAQQMLGGNAMERSRALEAARTLGPQNVGPELRGALITALEREGQIRAQRYQAGRRGEALQSLEDPEFIARVSRVVAELRDPRAIPALMGALGTGAPVTRALVAFGEEAVPALLAAVRSRETMDDVVDEALLTLRFMVEGAGPHSLSAGTLNDIRRAAKQRLSGKQYFSTLWWAIDLAIALKDPDLRRIVQSLASDRDAVVARGIEDSETIEETQRLAAERLAGVPPKPRRP